MINTYDLKAFIVTAKKLHFTKAAKELGMSQPALSHSIKRLEEEVGESLFLRRKEGILLTKAGLFLFKKGNNILLELEEITYGLSDQKNEAIKSLSLGLHPSVACYTLPFILGEMPNFQLDLTFDLSQAVTSLVQQGKIDCALAINPYPHSNLIISELGEDQFSTWINAKKFNSDFLFYDPKLNQSHFIIRQLDKKGIKFKNIVEISNLELLSQLVYEGQGVGILPSRVIKNHYPEKTKLFSSKIKPYVDKICFVYSVESKYNENIKAFKNQLSSHFKNKK